MREADGHEELVHVDVVQLEGLPLAVGRRSGPDVGHDVEDRPASAPHELGLPRSQLEVHSAQRAPP